MRMKIDRKAVSLLRSRWVCLLLLVVFIAVISGCPKPPPITPESTPTPTPTPTPSPEVILRLHGSGTIGEKLVPDLSEAFLRHKGASDIVLKPGAEPNQLIVQGMIPEIPSPQVIEILSEDSKVAFENLAAGKCDIGFTSRRIEQEELQALAVLGDMTTPASEHIVALDGIAIIVNGENPVETLSKDQILGIFSGDIQDWSDVGSEAGPITVYTLDQHSGTYEAFEQLVLVDRQLTDKAIRVDSSLALSEKVFGDRQGIGFVSLAHIGRGKAIAVQDGNAIPLKPDEEYIAAEDYLFAQRFYFYLPKHVEHPLAREFVDFVLSQDGQEVVAQHGFVDLNIKLGSFPGYARSRDREYQEATRGAEKLSLNIRFRYDSSKLDNKALQDIKRIDEFLRSNEEYNNCRIDLLGFCDEIGSQHYNEKLSKKRAQSVERSLLAQGVPYPIKLRGFGKKFPIATNETERGRAKNRRVEIWLFNPDWKSGSNCSPKGATVISLNGIDHKGSADYNNGDRTDWYHVKVEEEGTLTYHVRQRTHNTMLFVEFYDDPENSPLETCSLHEQDTHSFTVEDAKPGTYYAKVFVGPGDASSYAISNTFTSESSPTLTPTPTPTPTLTPTPTPMSETPLPQITILSPEDESTTTEDSVVITGRVDTVRDIALLTINGEQVPFNAEGEFTHEVAQLNMGPNTISVAAWDTDGNLAVVEIKIIHQ